MPIGIGSIGDIIAIIGIARELATALSNTRGAKSEYLEIQRELSGLEQALLCHDRLIQARYDDSALNEIFKRTKSTVEDCQRCIEVFSKQSVKFDGSLGRGERKGGGCEGVVMKVRWQMGMRDEVERFRKELSVHVMTLHMLLTIADINIQRINQNQMSSKLEGLEKKLELHAKTQEDRFEELHEKIENGIRGERGLVGGEKDDLKLGWLRQLGTELKGMVSNIFTLSQTTLTSVQRIETLFQAQMDQSLIRTFVLEDALGRVTRVDMLYISSWDAFDNFLEGCFREFPGHTKVARREYMLQDSKNRRQIKRSVPWAGAFVPGQFINMGLVFQQERKSSAESGSWCPRCYMALESPGERVVYCNCGLSHQRIIKTWIIPERSLARTRYDGYDSSDIPPIYRRDSLEDQEISEPSYDTYDENYINSENESEDITEFKNAILVEVENQIKYEGSSLQQDQLFPDHQKKTFDISNYDQRIPGNIPRATESDALTHGLSRGLNLSHWDPRETPIVFFGTVYDVWSLGKIMYDSTTHVHGIETPYADMAAEMSLLLVQISQVMIRLRESISTLKDLKWKDKFTAFLREEEKLFDRLQDLLGLCERTIVEARGRRKVRNRGIRDSDEAGVGLVLSFLARDKHLGVTEQLMTSIRLWNLRVDYCYEDFAKENQELGDDTLRGGSDESFSDAIDENCFL